MTWEQIKNCWEEISKQVMAKWGKLSEMEIVNIAGRRELLIQSLLSHYNWGHAKTERIVDDFARGINRDSLHRNSNSMSD